MSAYFTLSDPNYFRYKSALSSKKARVRHEEICNVKNILVAEKETLSPRQKTSAMQLLIYDYWQRVDKFSIDETKHYISTLTDLRLSDKFCTDVPKELLDAADSQINYCALYYSPDKPEAANLRLQAKRSLYKIMANSVTTEPDSERKQEMQTILQEFSAQEDTTGAAPIYQPMMRFYAAPHLVE